MPSKWLRQRKRDHFHRLAREHGYRSRAAFKLIQVAEKYHFIKRGQSVLDLGAAPGGWLQVAQQLVGTHGYVLGVDKMKIMSLHCENVSTIIADITRPHVLDSLREARSSKYDVIIADLSPNVSGVWDVDHARQIDLSRCALKIAHVMLKPSGNMLSKAFQGVDLKDFQIEMQSAFQTLRIVKPPASRSESAELYLLGLDFLG